MKPNTSLTTNANANANVDTDAAGNSRERALIEECFTSETWRGIVNRLRHNVPSKADPVVNKDQAYQDSPDMSYFNRIDKDLENYIASLSDIGCTNDDTFTIYPPQYANISSTEQQPPTNSKQKSATFSRFSIQTQTVKQLVLFMNEFFIAGYYRQACDILRVLSPIYPQVGSYLWPIYVRLFRLIPSYQPNAVRFLQELSILDKKNASADNIYIYILHGIIDANISVCYDVTRE